MSSMIISKIEAGIASIQKKADALRAQFEKADNSVPGFALVVVKGIQRGLWDVLEEEGKTMSISAIVESLGFSRDTTPKASGLGKQIGSFLAHFKAGFTEEELKDIGSANFAYGASRAGNFAPDSDVFENEKARKKVRATYLENIKRESEGGLSQGDFKAKIASGDFGPSKYKPRGRKSKSGNGTPANVQIDMKANLENAFSIRDLEAYDLASYTESLILASAYIEACIMQMSHADAQGIKIKELKPKLDVNTASGALLKQAQDAVLVNTSAPVEKKAA